MSVSGIAIAIVLATFPSAIPIWLAALGETVDQASGVLDLGVEGIMLMGAIVAFVVDYFYHSALIAFIAAGLVGLAFSAVHAFISITLNGDQVVSGTALWFIGWGLSGVIYAAYFGLAKTPPSVQTIGSINIPELTSIPIIGKVLFGESPLFYISIIITIALWYVMFRTQFGLNLRSVGENPLVAEVMGVSPVIYRYVSVLFGGFMAGLAGAYLTVGLTGSFYFDMTAGMGFIAVALVYFGKWNPWRVSVGAVIFGFVYALSAELESVYTSIPYQFFSMWPYIATLLIILAVGKSAHAPDALTMPYVRE